MFSRSIGHFVPSLTLGETRAISQKILRNSRAFSTTTLLRHRSTDPTIPNTSIKIFREIPALRQWRRKQLHDYRTVGLVPTMGALHSGHLSLIREAARDNSSVV